MEKVVVGLEFMRVVYNGCAIMTYGKNNLSISDKEGRILFTTTDRYSIIKSETENDLKHFLKQYLKDNKNGN